MSFSHHPLWHRFLIVVAGPGLQSAFAALALFLVFTVSGIPYLTTEIGGVKEDSPAALVGLQKGDQSWRWTGQTVSAGTISPKKSARSGNTP